MKRARICDAGCVDCDPEKCSAKKKYYHKHKDMLNAEARERYHTDAAYRQDSIARSRAYYAAHAETERERAKERYRRKKLEFLRELASKGKGGESDAG